MTNKTLQQVTTAETHCHTLFWAEEFSWLPEDLEGLASFGQSKEECLRACIPLVSK